MIRDTRCPRSATHSARPRCPDYLRQLPRSHSWCILAALEVWFAGVHDVWILAIERLGCQEQSKGAPQLRDRVHISCATCPAEARRRQKGTEARVFVRQPPTCSADCWQCEPLVGWWRSLRLSQRHMREAPQPAGLGRPLRGPNNAAQT